MGLALLLAAPAASPARGAREPAAGVAAKKKRKAVTCKPAQTRVTAGTRIACVTLRKPPAQSDARLVLLRGLLRRDPGVVRARGRRFGPIWKAAGGRVKRMRAKLLRDLPRFLAFADAPRVKASESVSGDRNCRGGLGESTASIDGFSLTSADNGDVTITASVSSGYAIEVFIGGAVRCSDLDLPVCPMADGTLDGTDGRGNALGVRVTKDGRLVQALRTVVRSKQTMKGKVAGDSKLDTMTLEDIANERTTFSLPDVTLNVTVSVRRAAEIDMRSGSPRPGTTRIQLGIGGLVGPDATSWADRARASYEQSFPELISEEVSAYRRRESAWQTPGTCAKLVFAPPSDTIKVPRSAAGTVTPHVEANAGGTATKAKWALSGQENGTFTPATVEAPSPAITYTPTGNDRQRLKAMFRATSTAGVAEAPWSQEIEDRVRYFRVTGAEYTDQLALDGLPPIGSCTQSTSQTNSTALEPSGQAYDGALGATEPGGALRGSLIARGKVTKTASFNGCKINDDATAYVSCTFMSGSSEPTVISVDIELGPTGATLTWHPHSPAVGYVTPVFGPCIPASDQGIVLDAVTTSASSESFTSAGPHTVAVDVPLNMGGSSGGTVHSTAHYAVTFLRVNADGSPYTG